MIAPTSVRAATNARKSSTFAFKARSTRGLPGGLRYRDVSRTGPTAKVTSMLHCARALPISLPFAMQPTETARLDSFHGRAARRIGEPCAAAWNEKPDRESGVYVPI